jgi:hypothetical protein
MASEAAVDGGNEMHDASQPNNRGVISFRGILLPLAVFASVSGPPLARSAEPASPTIKIEATGPVIEIEIRDVALPELLKELSNKLHFALEGVSMLNADEKISVSARGNLEDILRRTILPGKGFVTFYRDKAIERIVILGSNLDGYTPEPGPTLAEAVRPSSGNPPTVTPSRATTPVRSGSAPANSSAATPLNTLLDAQITVQRQGGAGANLETAIPTVTAPMAQNSPTSMAVLTQTAMQNVLALSSALRSVCIGPNCGQ